VYESPLIISFYLLLQTQETDLERYLLDPCITDSKSMTWDISNWWLKEGTGKYPSLAKMARDVLTVQASSVASESEFSTSGRVVTDFRSSLAPRKVRLLMLMKSW